MYFFTLFRGSIPPQLIFQKGIFAGSLSKPYLLILQAEGKPYGAQILSCHARVLNVVTRSIGGLEARSSPRKTKVHSRSCVTPGEYIRIVFFTSFVATKVGLWSKRLFKTLDVQKWRFESAQVCKNKREGRGNNDYFDGWETLRHGKSDEAGRLFEFNLSCTCKGV